MKQAFLIIGHGSRLKEGNQDFDNIIHQVIKHHPEALIYGAHMAHAQPSIETQVNRLYHQEVRKIIIIPYFLYGGSHIKQRIPSLLEQLCTKLPGLSYEIKPTLNQNPAVIKALSENITDQ
ncbi:Sirohydrochlorin ferrochelatase [invertebrate metagenome]|uniref:Sirohydrochlorin ferrochelatase n=1 Tax=invertebrate metagenome TaxID=1711999 RepID=A0A2H9T7J3_9ZZZZ